MVFFLEYSAMSRLFVSQELLDQWAVEGKIELAGNTLKLLAEQRAFHLLPGVRFLSLAAGQDRARLLGRVKSEEQLQTIGAELYMNSVLLEEDAYDVQCGFLAEVSGFAPSVEAATTAISPPPTQSSPAQAGDERSLLEKFLLENLT
jgi:hypothetical protein